ncbi:MAG: decaprenyl-phosphate phosphoribosyltransferase [Prevotella sp.]|nr:decaprenyl-phosphate phosphoribosyltransferase [Prevotella sp.]
MKYLIQLIRPKQWVKNVFVLLPMFFGGTLMVVQDVMAAVITFFSFSFAASSIYCFNDLIDLEADRRHPDKCGRPLAAGKVSKGQAYVLMGVMIVLSMLLLLLLPVQMLQVAGIILFYWLLNLAYCLWLKEFAIVDVCIVAFGFVLRLLAGGLACETPLSRWIVLMTFLLTLFLSFAKRRDDVLRMNQTGQAPRKNTSRYNLTFINQAVTITASVTLVCYIMYTVSPEVIGRFGTDQLYLTSFFVLLGLLRYVQLTVVDEKSGDPTKLLLHDHLTQAIVMAWVAAFIIIIYL